MPVKPLKSKPISCCQVPQALKGNAMKTMSKAVHADSSYFYNHAQRLLETLRMYVLAAPEFSGFKSCQHWTAVNVFLTKEDPVRLWSMVAAAFPEGDAVGEAAALYKEKVLETPDEYTGIQSFAIALLTENAKRWKFHK